MERKCRLTVIGTWICLGLALIVSEAKAQIHISKSSLTIEEGGKGSYKLHLDAPPSAEITLDITTTNSDVQVNPETLTFTSGDWDRARKITVEAIRDADAEDDHAIISHFVRTASNRRRGSANLQPASATVPSSLTVIVLDRFVPSHEVNISPSSGLSIRKGGSGNYSVSLTEKPTASVTVWASSDRSDVRVSPSSLTFYVGTWGSTQSFNVSVDADATSSSATISHSATSEDINYQGLTIDSLPVTVLQPPAGITQPPSRTKVLVGQTKSFYSPELRSQPTHTVTINASSQAAGNATVTGSKSFSSGNWNTAQDFNVTGRSPGTATITYDVDSSDSRYDGYRLSSTSVTVEATTITCRADDINIQLGSSSTLSWDSTNANSVAIDQGIGSVPVDSPRGGKTVRPPQPGAAETSKATTYRFTAAGGGDPGTCSVTITVWRPPSVDGFSADPTTLRKQQTTRLSWATGHTSSTTIDQGVGSVPVDSSGQGQSVSPPQPSTAETSRSTSYTLTASNPGYTGANAASATVSVTVWNRPSVDSFTASPSTIDEGEDSGLKWTTTHATGVSIDRGVGSVAVDDQTGTTKVSPHQDTTYTLTASNPGYTGTQAVTDTLRITVNPATVPQPPAGITQPPSRTKVLVGQTKIYYSPGLRSQPTGTVTINASSQATGTATATDSRSFGSGNWSTAQDFNLTGRSVGTATITYDVDSRDSRYDGYRLSSTSVTVEATTITCRADDINIQLGGSSTLSWDSTNANNVTIDQGVGSVPLDSPREGKTVTPPQPGAAETSKATTYRFTAAGGGDPGTCSVTITVWRPPSVDGFSADPTTLRKQQTTRLSWATGHASSTTIDQGVGSVPVDSSGQGRSVSPPQPSTAETSRSTSYTLTASNPGYTGADAASAAVSVTVWNRPSVDSFTASPSTIDEGEDSGLKWTTTHATGVSIDRGVGSVAVDDQTGTTKVSPHQDTTYTLTASNPGYTGTQAVTDTLRITVNPATVPQPPAGITQPPSRTKVLVGQTKSFYSPELRSQPTHTVTINASSQAAGNATVTGSKSFGSGNWNTAQDFNVTGRSPGTATITYDVDSSDSRYDGYRLSSTSVTVEATTITCRADDINIQLGSSSTLSWDSTNANSVAIDQGIGSVPVDSPRGGKTVRPPQPGAAETSKATTYRFTAAGGGDPGTCSVTITVWRPPSVDGFSADPTTLRKQQTTRLSWATSHASGTSINQGVGSVPVDGSGQGQSVSPPQPSTAETSKSTRYTLTASNPGYAGTDAASATVSVTVWNRPSVDSFTASPSTIDEGEDSGLKWTTTHATGVSIDRGVGSVAVDDQTGTTKVSPHQDTTYTLTASNPGYTGTRAVTDTLRITVNPPARPPGLSISPTTLNITEGAAGKTYNVRLRTQPSRDVTVTVEVKSGGDSRVQKNTSSLTFTTSDWNRNQAVQVFAEEKSGTATGQARIANTPSSSYGGSAVDVTVNVADDDTDGCGATVTPTRLTINEGETNGGYYDVELAARPAASVTITLDLTGDPSLSADRSALTFTSGNWNTSQRVTIEAREDADYFDGRATIGHTASSTDEGCSGMSISSVSVNIRDDDEPPPLPRITLSSDEAGVSEPDGTAIVTAAVTGGEEPAGDLTINLTHSGQATNGTDYTVATLTIESGETSGNAELSVIDDKFAEGTEEIRLIAGARGYRDSAPLSMILTDDDSAGVTVTPTILTIPEGSRLAYRVMLTSRPSHNVTVTVSRSGDRDIGIDDQELTFTDSDWKTARTVTVTAAQDDDAIDDTAIFSHSVASTDTDYNGITVSEVEVTVTDDEMAGVSIAPAQLTIAEGGSDTYQVVLTSQPSHEVTVTITHSGDTDIDRDPDRLTFSSSNWNTEQTVTVSTAQDGDGIDDAATLSHTVTSTDADYNGIGVSEVAVTVTDNEAAGVSIGPAQLTIAEGGSDSYEVVLTSQPSHDVTVTISRSGDGDVSIDDQELTFTASNWETAQAVTVSAAQDEDARDDTAAFSHSVASTDTNYNRITVSEVAVTVTDDETAGVSITPTELTIAEGGSDSYQVVLTSQPAHDVTITITHGGDPDIGIANRELTFTDSDWETAQTVTVAAAQDEDARDDTATLGHSVASTDGDYNGISVSQVAVTATDDETASVSITPTQLTIAEGGSDTYQVFLTSQPAQDVTITITHSGDADIDSDLDRLTFSSSDWKQEKTVTVRAAQDDDARDDTVTLSHSVASTDGDYNGIGVSEVAVTATDDETAGVSITPTQLTIAEGGSGSYRVVLTSKPSHEVTVAINHGGDNDIDSDPDRLTFSPSNWNQEKTVAVTSAQDEDARDDTAALSHSVASTDTNYNRITVSQVAVTATDDETASVSITPTQLTIAEGGSDTYQVFLTSQPAHDVTVTIIHSGDAGINSDADRLTFASSDWNQAQTVAVTADQDDDARDDAATLGHSVASTDGDYNGIGVPEVAVTATDDETASVSITPTQLTIAEGGSDSYRVFLTSQPAHDVTVTITHSGDGDIGMDHQELTFTGSDWETAQTVTVSAAQDDDARDDTATLSHTVASADGDYNGISVSQVDVTATDDETAGVSITPRQLTIAEGGSDSYRVVLTSQPAHDVTVTITHGGDNDIDSDPDRLTFSPSNWNQEKTVTVTSAQDDDARDDTATLSHTVSSTDGDYNGITVPEVDVTATDDETAGVSILPEELTITEGGSDSYQVVLTSQPAHDVTVTISYSGDQDVSIDDQELTFTGSDWETAQTVTVSAAQDDDARDDTATLSHSVASTDGDYNGIGVSEVDVTATDDETAGVSITPRQLTIAEGGSDSYEVVLTSQPAHDVTVTITHSGDGDIGNDHQELTFTGSDWETAQTVTVSAAQDDDARDDSATLSHSVASTDGDYNGISVSQVAVAVTDDEMAGVSILPEELTIAEGGSHSYQVVLTSQPAHDVTVTISYSGDQDVSIDDQELTFTGSDWETPQTVTVSADQDDDARDDTATLSHSVASTDGDYNGIGVSEVDVTATDDETASVSITPTQLTIAEGGSDSYAVVLTSQPAHDVTITINHGGDADIDSAPDRLTFSPSNWNQEKTVTVTSAQDDDARDDTATLSHNVASTDGDYNGITVSEIAVAVTDDETAGVSITPTELTIAEGGSDAYQAVLTSQPAHDVTVTISYSGDQDVSIDDQELTFTGSDWETPQTVTVSAAQDDDARDDVATLSHSVASTDEDYNGIGVSAVDVAVTDDETAGVSIWPELTIAEGASDSYQVVLTSQPAHDVTVTITHSGDGDIGNDHQELTFTGSDWETPQAVTVSAAQDEDARDDCDTQPQRGAPQTVTVSAAQDDDARDDDIGDHQELTSLAPTGRRRRHGATLSHSVASTDEDYNGIGVSAVDVAVTDDETAGVSIWPEELTIAEGASDSYQVVLTSQPAHDVTVTITHSGDGDIGNDHQELTFTGSDWETPQAVTVSAAQDEDARDDVATLSHSVASTDEDYNGIAVPEVVVAVTDDETAGVFITPTELTIAEGGSDSYRVFLTSQPAHDVTVTITHSGDGDIGMDHQELTFTGSDWETAQAVTVSADQDEDARDDAATLSHSVSSTDGDYNGITVPEVDVTATDDETADVSITPRQLNIAEGGSDSYEVVLTSQPAHDVTVTITHSGDGDIGNDHQELTFTGSDWETPQTVTVSADQDEDARDDTATLSHSVSSTDGDYNGIGVSEVEVTATDDETAGVSITPRQLTIAEGGSDSYRVVLTSKPSHEVTVTINHGGDNDIDSDPDRLTFSPSNWNQAKTVTVTSAQDDDARDDTATLSHTVASADADYNGITVPEVDVTATDDETAGVSITPRQLNIAEGGSDSYEVVLTSQPAHDVTVTITHSGDGDIGNDHQELTFTGSDWETPQTVTVSADQDEDARDDTATLSHSVSSTDGDYNGIGVSEVEVTATDDETAGVSITPRQLTIAEGGSDSYRVVLTSKPSHEVTVTINHGGDNDIDSDPDRLTFSPSNWNQAKTVTVTSAQDDDARDDTATLSHTVSSTDGDYNGITVPEVAVTATDDETTGVSIRPTELTIAEGGSDSYEVVLTSQPSHEVTVTITHSGDRDISIGDQELTFTDSDWNQAQTVAVTAAHDDDAIDDTATFSHTVASADGDYNGITVSEVEVTATDDETAGVSIRPTELTIAEWSSDSYEVVLTSQPSHEVTVTITHSGDRDISIGDQELTFTDSDWNQAQTVAVTAAHDDDAIDDTATFSHTVASADGDYNGITVSEVEVTATDDETAGVSITPTKLTIAEGGSDSYQVVLTSQPSHEVTVTITHSGDGDISINDQELTFTDSDWETAQTVAVAAVQDGDARDDTATLSHTVSSTDGDYNGVTVSAVDVTVRDDETPGVSIRPEELIIAEGASDSYEVVLTSQPSHDVTVTITHSGDAEIDSAPDRLTFSSSDWSQEKTVTVRAAQDDDARDDTATLSHSVASTDGDYNGITVSEVAVAVTDDETAGVSIKPTKLTIAEGGSDSYEVVLTSQPSHDVTVTITHSGDRDISIGDQELTFTGSDWETAQTVTVSAAQDEDARHDAASLSHTVTSADTDYNGIGVSEVDIAVTDDETAGVSIRPEELTIAEGASDSYEVVLTSQPSHDVTVTITHSGDGDISIGDQELTFTDSDWGMAKTVSVSSSQDGDAIDDTATLGHSMASADTDYNGIAVPEVAVTVTDDETAGVKVAPTRLAIPEDASTTYTVALTSRPSRPVVVALSHSGDPDISANLAQVSFEPSEWDNPSTVTVQASRDPDAVDDTATLRHSVSSSDSTYDGAPVDPVRITVGDLDSVGVNITPLNLTIDEGASRTYTVVLASKPSQDVVVEVDRTGDEDVVPQPDSLTFTGSNWQDPQAVTVQALQDPDAVDDTATLLHSTSSSDAAYGGLTVSDVSVSVIDDDTTGVNVSPLELAVLEGTSETCTVALAGKPSAEVHISLNSNNNDVSPSPAFLTFSPTTWSTAQEVMVPVAQDEDATDEVATLTFSATSPDPAYHGISVPAVSVDINDDDNAGVKVVPNPHMSVPEGESATYTIVLLSQPLATVAVAISSSNPQMLTAAFDEVTFTQDNWRVAQTVAFDTFHDDNTLDENEVLSHSAVSLDPNYKGISVTPLLVTITDRTAEKLTRTLPVLLSAMSGALAESIQTAVESRFERRRQMQRMKQDQGWWMPSYYQDRSRLSPEFNPSGGPETEPILSRASFGLPLAGNAFDGTHWRPVLWGHGDFQHFNGTSSLVDFRGRLSATHVGMDLLSNRHVLTGLSFARSWGAMGYSDDREGRLAASFNTFHPYLYWQPHRRLSLWGIGGMGRGSVDLRDPRLAHVFNSEFRMWAGGLRSLLTKPGKNELGFRLDGFMSKIAIDPLEQIREVFGRASRARAMLEAVHQRGGRKRSFSLKGEIGGRLDRGEAVHGAAMETGLRLGFIDTPTGLDLSLQGRMLLFHDGGYRDWGAGLQASWDPGNKRRGLRMSAASSHGQNGRAGATLWDDSYAYAFGQGRSLPGNPVPLNRIDSEAAYGMEVLQGRGLLTPFSRLRWTGHGKEFSVGSEFGLQPRSPDTNPLNLELQGVRGKSSRGPDMGVRIRMSIPF